MSIASYRSFDSIIASPGFLFALIVLLVNDHLLKYHYPGILTGKLSDFSGLFLVGLLLLSWRRVPAAISLATIALLFIWWKSPLSADFILAWGELGLPPLQRVVDYSDLVALISLPLAHGYWRHHHELSFNRLLRIPIIVSTAFAIGATSMPYYSITMVVQDPEPVDSSHTSNSSSICGIQLVRDIDRIVRNHGYKTIDNSGTDCGYKAANATSQDVYYRHYSRDEGMLTLYYNKTDHTVSLNMDVNNFRERSEILRRSLRDELMRHGYSLQVGNRVIRQRQSAHVRLLIAPAENTDPLYPSHYYDLLRLPLIIDSYMLKNGFHPVDGENCGNDAYYGRERICKQYLSEDTESPLPLITLTLTSYLLYGQPPMEVSIVQFGDSQNIPASTVAINLQETIERAYPELEVKIISSTKGP